MDIKTYKIGLEPDKAIPKFKRLTFEEVPIALKDVFKYGIYPLSILRAGIEYSGASVAMGYNLNLEKVHVPNFKQLDLSGEIKVPKHDYYSRSKGRLYTLLETVAADVYFVDKLTYAELLEIAIMRLRKLWSDRIASSMARKLYSSFDALRNFLKTKKPDIKLIGYKSANKYDLSTILSVDDFLTEDKLLITHGIPTRNFRLATAIDSFIDANGLLRLSPSIKHCTIAWVHEARDRNAVVKYHCTVDGDSVQWQPDLAESSSQNSEAQRLQARKISSTFEAEGKYCFSSSFKDMEFALKDEHFTLRFPDLDYETDCLTAGEFYSEATVAISFKAITCYGENTKLHKYTTNDYFKSRLREFGKKLTGKKDELIQRLAELLVEQYTLHKKEMDMYFSTHKFVRLDVSSKSTNNFPVLTEHKLRAPLLLMYCLRHTRGNTILEAEYENHAVELVDLAKALCGAETQQCGICGITVPTSFVPVQ